MRAISLAFLFAATPLAAQTAPARTTDSRER
jgi:hypothetical protein